MKSNIKREADESTFDGQSKKLKAEEGCHRKFSCPKCPGKSWLTKSGLTYHRKTKHDTKEASSSQEVSAKPVAENESSKCSGESTEPNKPGKEILGTTPLSTGPLNQNQVKAEQAASEELSRVLEENRQMRAELAAVGGEAPPLPTPAGVVGWLSSG